MSQLGWTILNVVAAAGGGGHGGGGHGHEAAEPVVQGVSYALPVLNAVAWLGVAMLVLGMVLTVLRMIMGPKLADRVIAGDTLSMQVVGLVILLAIKLKDTLFFDAALVVGIIGFASTVAFAQYLGAMNRKQIQAEQAEDQIEDQTAQPEGGAA